MEGRDEKDKGNNDNDKKRKKKVKEKIDVKVKWIEQGRKVEQRENETSEDWSERIRRKE